MIRVAAAVLVVAMGVGNGTHADMINLSGAETAPNILEITVAEDRVHLALEIHVGDLAIFEALLPDSFLQGDSDTRPPLTERLRQFSTDTLSVLTDTGERLQPDLVRAEPRLRKERYSPFAGAINPTTGRKAPEAPADKRVLYVELVYPFTSRPKDLTFVPPLDDSEVPRATMGFIANHGAVAVIDFNYLSRPETLHLDWKDPWYSRFENPKLKRSRQVGLASFLYIEQSVVRHEVLARARDLAPWIDLGLRDERVVAPDEREDLLRRVGDLLAARNPLTIDGKAVVPQLLRAEFVEFGPRGAIAVEHDEPLDSSVATVGVILEASVASLPTEVMVEWDLFSDRIERVPAITIDPAGPFATSADAGDPMITWRNFLKAYEAPRIDPVPLGDERLIRVPLPSLVLVVLAVAGFGFAIRPRGLPRLGWGSMAVVGLLGAAVLGPFASVEVERPFSSPPDPEASAEIVAQLASNLLQAAREEEGEDLRRALSATVATPHLSTVLPEVRRAFAIEIQDGSKARVDAVEQTTAGQIEELGDGGFRTLAAWTAEASGGHWGHLHQRRLRFRALMDVVPEGRHWKLADVTVIEIKSEI